MRWRVWEHTSGQPRVTHAFSLFLSAEVDLRAVPVAMAARPALLVLLTLLGGA